ncbi:MAG: hypothetical protein QF486_06260 [Candidatus Woesearchaeota archaeon]|jgi:hypothetical protein|nr:hypothetical protein [Candidatus Woesearchaeota archaeon]MDP7180873.1 hypothetical protein [Candidatus Woesearchaeota archaeon]MDP7199189.1 hypothetical protein [Candidatus Woesearchaeota archaeon]MDP7467548.1 hypothetical protein [Candidatus Woesearchaeota archaeon]MDP7647030.1 hypothetical protein [Candidatus Woesearchaeota archaeon]|tara:strand:+ start:531 stop:806 length:276 start_codon:yes stop_codon:yes gene_type:complete
MKAQGLPITVIIVAALGLLVLVVIAAIFSGQVGKFGRIASECAGRCHVADEGTTPCVEGRERAISGVYIKPNQQVKADKLVSCTQCCVAIG